MRAHWLAAIAPLALAASACSTNDLDMTLSAPTPLALGSRGWASPSDACGSVGNKSGTCSNQVITVLDFDVSPPSVAVAESVDSYHATFRAVGEGTAHVSLTADNGFRTETLTGDVQVMRADSATLAPVVLPTTLSLGWKPLVTASCAEPYRIQTGAPLDLEYELAAGGIPLRADDYCPFSSPALAFGACKVGTYMRNGTTLVTTQTLVATAAAVPQSATIGSDVDPGVAIAVDLVDAAAVDGVQLSDPVIVDSRKYLFAWATSGGVPLCSDALERTIVSETPDLCEVLDRDFPGPRAWKRPGLYEVWPKAKGMCRIRATLVETGLTTVREYATY